MISVIIATRDRRDLLARTLPSVLEQRYPAASLEVVVVNDGSSDGTAQWLRALRPRCRLVVIDHHAQGPAAARNAGIAAAEGQLLLFLDDDILCDPNLVAEHAEGHRLAPGDPVHGNISLSSDSPRTLVARSTGAWYDSRHAAILGDGGLLDGAHVFLNANTSYPAEVIRRIGGFDAQMRSLEDVELGLRLREAGIRVQYRPEARAFELFVKSSRVFARDAHEQGVADVMISRKHPRYRRLTPIASSDPPPLVSAAVRAAFRRLPDGVETALDRPAALAERLIARPRARSLGDRMLAIQRQVAFDRAASRYAGGAELLEAEFCRYLPVLLYHRVGSPVAGLHSDLTVSPRVFATQLGWLRRRGYAAITAAAWHEWCSGRGSLPAKPVLITFDDGYADLVEHALPILERLRFTATIFVVTERIGAVTDWDGPAAPRLPTLSAEQIAAWSARGFEFGAHSRTHPDLATLARPELAGEVAGSRADLEQIVQRPVRAFAYPYGSCDEAAHAAARDSYDLAFVANGRVNALRTPLHLLRRAGVGDLDSGPELEWRAWTGERPFGLTRDRLRAATAPRRS